MKNKIIELFKLAGYSYVKESPEGRLLFYDDEMEQDVQFWVKNKPKIDLADAISLIKQRCYDNGVSCGKSQIQSELKKLLGL